MSTKRASYLEKSLKDLTVRVFRLEKKLKMNSIFCQSQPINAIEEEKCGSTLSKIELSQLFYFLMDEKILFFDQMDSKLNRSKMQQFLIRNLTYAGDGGAQTAIHSISKQFSECAGYTYREKQIDFLNNLAVIIQRRHSKLKSW